MAQQREADRPASSGPQPTAPSQPSPAAQPSPALPAPPTLPTSIDERSRQAERERIAFMQNLAHELSNPLTPLSGYLKILLAEKLGALGPQQRRVLDSMSSAVGRLTRVVENLSDFANLQSGRASVLATPLDPDQLANEVVEELRPAVRESHLHVRVQPSRGGTVQADARKLRQALSNLIGNAVKFSPHGGEVLVELSRKGDRLTVTIYDQGAGIPLDEQPHLFEPLYRAARAKEARAPGSGLGLPVARRIAEAHGGRLTVESPPLGQPAGAGHHFAGTKVVLEIPVAQPGE